GLGAAGRRAAAHLGRAVEDLDRTAPLRRAGEGRRGDGCDVVGGGAAAVAGGRHVRGRGGRGGHRVDGERVAGPWRLHVADVVGSAGARGIRVVGRQAE